MWKFHSTNQRAPHNSYSLKSRVSIAHTTHTLYGTNTFTKSNAHNHMRSYLYDAMTYIVAHIHACVFQSIACIFEKVLCILDKTTYTIFVHICCLLCRIQMKIVKRKNETYNIESSKFAFGLIFFSFRFIFGAQESEIERKRNHQRLITNHRG